MFKVLGKKILLPLYFVIGSLVLELITFNLLNIGIFPKYFFYNLAIVVFIATLISLIPNFKAQYIIFSIILVVQAMLVYVDYSLYVIYGGDLFSVEMIQLFINALEAATSSFFYMTTILQIISVAAIELFLGSIVLKFCNESKVKAKDHYNYLSLVLIGITFVATCGTFFGCRHVIDSKSNVTEDNYVLSDSFALNTAIMKASSYSKFGTYGYLTNMIINTFTKYDSKIKNSALYYFNNGDIYTGSDSLSGVAENNNIIMIMMESAETFCFEDGLKNGSFSKELTPNIYSLLYGDDIKDIHNTTIFSSNFFAKSKTNFSEGISVLSNYPVGESLTNEVKNLSKDSDKFGYSLPSVLKTKGYTTSYIHSNTISYYDRNKTHEYLGFDNVVGKNNFYSKNCLKWDSWDTEENFVNKAMNYIVPTDNEGNALKTPFMSFYLNVSSHGSYGDNVNNLDQVAYKNLVENSEWYANISSRVSNAKDLQYLKNYEATMVGLDRAIGAIVDKLLNTSYVEGDFAGDNLFDHTTFVLFADHNVYYESLSNKVKGLDLSNNLSIELNTIPMIISTPKSDKFDDFYGNTENYYVNDRFCSAYDITPTLLDILGIGFNENLYLGRSIFAPKYAKYTIDDKEHEMILYYSITGGVFGQDLYIKSDMNSIVNDNSNVNDEITELFKEELKKKLIKTNYISVLNKYNLFNELTNTFA